MLKSINVEVLAEQIHLALDPDPRVKDVIISVGRDPYMRRYVVGIINRLIDAGQLGSLRRFMGDRDRWKAKSGVVLAVA